MKQHVFKKAVLPALLAVAFALAGCSGNTAGSSDNAGGDASGTVSGEPITLTFFDKNTGDAFTNPVALEIVKQTGVNIEVQQPTGNPDEKLSLMLASGTMADILLMDRRSDIVNKFISAGGLIALNDLIDQHGPDIKDMYGDVLNKSRYEDGKNYFLNNWYGIDPDPDRGIDIRMDLLKEMGYGERAEKGDAFTQDEFVEMLTEFRDTYSGDGSPLPFTHSGDYLEATYSIYRGMYGMKTYYETDGNRIQLLVRHPRYLEMMKFMNMLFRENLLDKEWTSSNADILTSKLITGQVMATAGGIPNDANNILKEDFGEDTDKQFYMFQVVADGVEPGTTTFSPRSSLGWDAIGITATNKYPVETIKFMNFLASDPGQYLLMWGIQGTHWDMEDGVHVPKPEIIPNFRSNWNNYAKETGIRKWTWFIKNGYGFDGTPYDLAAKYDPDPITAHAHISMEGSVWDTANYDSLGPAGGTPDALVEQVLKDIMDKGFSNMAYAASEADVEKIYNAMIAELESNNAASIEAIYTKTYQERLTDQK